MTRELFKRGRPQERVNWLANRRSRWNGRRVLRVAGLGLLAACLAAAGVFIGPRAAGELRVFLRRQESLSARKLILEGNRRVSREAILSALGLGEGDNLLEVDLKGMARRLEDLPAVKSALVERHYPSALLVRIVERRPLMVIGGAQSLVLDDEGVVMGSASGEGSLPVVANLGLGGRRVKDPAAVEAVKELKTASLAAGLGWPGICAMLDFAGPDGPVAALGGQVTVRLGRGGYRQKLTNLARVLPQLRGQQWSVSYIDLRFDQRVVVGTNPPQEKSPAPGEVKSVG